ncbi:hypothetical protein GCM10010390_19140 [Streptomyces mordarskii]|uniref:Uncharacterized protein n=1 Tax=Streptomyces mordarskii TaxID=1226758 RepID=A0ABN1CDN9_9ACTN
MISSFHTPLPRVGASVKPRPPRRGQGVPSGGLGDGVLQLPSGAAPVAPPFTGGSTITRSSTGQRSGSGDPFWRSTVTT